MSKSTEELVKEGAKIKLYRVLMGMRQKEMSIKLETNQPNYCRMEQGRLDSCHRLEIVVNMFKSWRNLELKRLQIKIDHLKSL